MFHSVRFLLSWAKKMTVSKQRRSFFFGRQMKKLRIQKILHEQETKHNWSQHPTNYQRQAQRLEPRSTRFELGWHFKSKNVCTETRRGSSATTSSHGQCCEFETVKRRIQNRHPENSVASSGFQSFPFRNLGYNRWPDVTRTGFEKKMT